MSKILHIGSSATFIPPYIELIKEKFNPDEHLFYLTPGMADEELKVYRNVHFLGAGKLSHLKGYAFLLKHLMRSEKIFLHGLFNWHIVVMLFFTPWLLKKTYWIMLGGDLYVRQLGRRDWKWMTREFFRKRVIKRMGHLITYIHGDVELARKWYGARGEYHNCLMYPSNTIDPDVNNIKYVENECRSTIKILVGNSADPSNNHSKMFEVLLPFKNKSILIYVPLSYGNDDHAAYVARLGEKYFGDKFIPLTEFICRDKYEDLLRSIDIAVFNHKRQQAMGNTIALLGMGKTVFMRNDVTQWSFLTSLGLKVKPISEFSLDVMDRSEAFDNSVIVKNYFSRDNLINQWDKIFRS